MSIDTDNNVFFPHSMNPELDVGQVEGAFMMGLGMWLTEKLIHDPQTGRNLTNGTWVSSSTSLNYLLNQASCQLLLPFLCLFVCFVLFCFIFSDSFKTGPIFSLPDIPSYRFLECRQFLSHYLCRYLN